jgi:hypothetical protein
MITSELLAAYLACPMTCRPPAPLNFRGGYSDKKVFAKPGGLRFDDAWYKQQHAFVIRRGYDHTAKRFAR